MTYNSSVTEKPARPVTPDDQAFVESLMHPVREPGKMASWVAPPATGLHGKPVDYEYVKL